MQKASLYFWADYATFIYLTFFADWGTGWSHLYFLPVHLLLSSMWPVYWAAVHWMV